MKITSKVTKIGLALLAAISMQMVAKPPMLQKLILNYCNLMSEIGVAKGK